MLTVISICGWRFINFVGSNCSELFITRFMYICLVCDSDNSSLSATNDNCSPRWIVHYQSRGHGYGLHIPAATSVQLCLEACAASTTCILAHWNRLYELACWLFTVRSRHRYYLDHVTQFEIVRQCDNSSGTWHLCESFRLYVKVCSKLHEWTTPTESRICSPVKSSWLPRELC